jgi:type III pantothenate kinase
MKPDLVVDVGNSRIKWGRCARDAVAEVAALPPDDPAAWQRRLDDWKAAGPLTWVLSGVHPQRRDRLADWLRRRGDTVRLVESAAQLPLAVKVEHPDKVGIDRLLDAVAANTRRRPGLPAVVIDAGSAVTVNYLDEDGAFLGGAILPGLRLMAQALHDYTALLPLVDLRQPPPPVSVLGPDPHRPISPVGTNTTEAVKAGILYAVVGGVESLINALWSPSGGGLEVFLTGGDADILEPELAYEVLWWPQMTLEGIRLTAEALP